MKCICQKGLLTAITIFSFFFLLTGCVTIGSTAKSGYPHPQASKTGPPDHAPAHGYRAKHSYRYYPSCSVYFDIDRSVYFYLDADSWRVSVELPYHLRIRLGEYVVVEMDTDKPYLDHQNHKNKYPPGQLKKNKSKEWVKSK